ncbi:class D sortase [Flavonifractor sp. An306]|uniref:class D sortase n=1 Tax=Flavonifractor sp. An306 TaxID=1965629 RepID=UPI00174E75FC|nr:class D sortase [Flavonifractor sp. An306]
MKRTRISAFFLATVLSASLTIISAGAIGYQVPGKDAGFFGPVTSIESELEPLNSSADISKNAAYSPPGFGTPESYIPNRAEQLINLKGTDGNTDGVTVVGPGTIDGSSVNGSVTIENGFPTVDGGSSGGSTTSNSGTIAFTPVTDSTYYSNGTLGTIKIPAIGVNFSIYEGTSSSDMLYGAGHFVGTSIWDGNVCLAAHNRGVANNFGKIQTLKAGDTITLTTVYGSRTYAVSSVKKVHETDTSCIQDSASNMITLVTCVANEREYRYVVQGYQV